MINVGVIGTGYIGKVHIDVLRRLPDVQVVAVADQDVHLAQSVAEMYNIPNVYSSPEEFLSCDKIEVVHNCTPNHIHFAINKKAIETGKDVLSEKPLSLTSAQSKELMILAAKFNTVTAVNFCYRYYPVVQEAAFRVRRGDLGEVRSLMGHFLQDWLFFDTDFSWRLEKEYAGDSNVMADLGSHLCDLVQFVTGRKITEVMAELHTTIPIRKKAASSSQTFSTSKTDNFVEVKDLLDEYASMFIRLDNGATGNFTTCQTAAGKKVDLEFRIFGSKCTYEWSHVRPGSLIIGNRDTPNETFYESPSLQSEETRGYATLPTGHPMGYHDAVYNLFKDYYQAIGLKRQGKPFKVKLPDFSAGHDEMKILESAVKSYKSGSWQKVGK